MKNTTVSIEQNKAYCKMCKNEMTQVPIKKINSLMIIEHYCPNCELSEISYENFKKI